MASDRRLLLLPVMLASLLSCVLSFDPTECVTCVMVTFQLWEAISKAKEQLEPTRQAGLKASEQTLKPQTKRWRAQEFDVALREAAERSLEHMCSAPAFARSKLSRRACEALLEAHTDELFDAVQAEKHAQLCARAVAGCEGERMREALDTLGGLDGVFENPKAAEVKSEPPPTSSEGRTVAPDHIVHRLVGLTFGDFVANVAASGKAHLLIMAYRSKAKQKKPAPPTVASAAFYTLARQLGPLTELQLRFAQIDTRKNDFALEVELPAGSVHFQLFLLGADPKRPALIQVDRHRTDGLRASGDDAVALQLVDGLLDLLPDKLQAGVRTALGITASSTAPPARTPPSTKRRAKTKASEASPEREVMLTQECEMCGLIAMDLHQALNQTKQKHGVSRSASDKRNEYVRSVQKPQTRRWLQREHGSILAAALEDRLEDICISRRLEALACSEKTLVTLDGIFAERSLIRRGRSGQMWNGEKFDNETCHVRVVERCPAAVEQYADGVTQGILGGRNADVCTELVPRCNQSVAQTFNHSYMSEQATIRKDAEKAEFERRSTPAKAFADALDDLAALGDLSQLELKEDL